MYLLVLNIYCYFDLIKVIIIAGLTSFILLAFWPLLEEVEVELAELVALVEVDCAAVWSVGSEELVWVQVEVESTLLIPPS